MHLIISTVGPGILGNEVRNCTFDEPPCTNPGWFAEFSLFIAKLAYPSSTFSFKEAKGFGLTESQGENTILNQVYNGTADISAFYMNLNEERAKYLPHMGQLTSDEVCNQYITKQDNSSIH